MKTVDMALSVTSYEISDELHKELCSSDPHEFNKTNDALKMELEKKLDCGVTIEDVE